MEYKIVRVIIAYRVKYKILLNIKMMGKRRGIHDQFWQEFISQMYKALY